MERCGQKLACLEGLVGKLGNPGAELAFKKFSSLEIELPGDCHYKRKEWETAI